MKRLFTIIGTALCALSCTTEAETTIDATTLELTIPAEIKEGTPAATNYATIDFEEYDLRLIMELYTAGETDKPYSRKEIYWDEQSTTFTLDELPTTGEYIILGWADFVTTKGEDLHYDTSAGLRNIMQNERAFNDDSYAAFALSTTIKDGKLAHQGAKLSPAASKYGIAIDDAEVAEQISTIESEYIEYISTGFNVEAMKPNTSDPTATTTGNKATFQDDSNVLATTYVLTDAGKQNNINQNIRLKNSSGEEVLKYSGVVIPLYSDKYTECTLAATEDKEPEFSTHKYLE